MAFTIDYKALMRKLEEDLLYTLLIKATDTKEFKRNLSQAKVRMGVEGRLQFVETYSSKEIEGENLQVVEIQVVLVPKAKKSVQVLGINLNKSNMDL